MKKAKKRPVKIKHGVWYPLSKVKPPKRWEDRRFLMMWRDSEHETDIGMDICSGVELIEDDFNDGRHGDLHWMSPGGCPVLKRGENW